MTIKLLGRIGLVAMMVIATACSDDGVGPTPPPAPRAESLAVAPDDLAIKVREQVQLEIRLVYNDGTVSKAADCRADNQNVTVNGAGLVTGQKPGEATITCSAAGKSATVHVRVVTPDPVFVIDPGVSEADVVFVKDVITMTNSYLEKVFGRGVLVEDTIFVRDSVSGSWINSDGHNRVFVRVKSPGWISAGRILRTKRIAGAQSVIFYNQENHDNWFGSRLWLYFGAGEFTAMKAMDQAGILPYSTARECIVYAVRSNSLPTLREIDKAAFPFNQYTGPVMELWGLAVEHLVGGDVAELAKFSQAEGSWPGNFEKAFGTTVDAFYTSFEGWRATWSEYQYHPECWE